MSTKKQVAAAKENIKKAQAVWKTMSPRQRALAQPEGKNRQKPGAAGKGKFFRIEIRPKHQFTTFRTHDVGGPGKLERITGRRSSGSWATVTWLIGKESAYMTQDKKLVITDPGVKTVLKNISEPITFVKGDIFSAKPRRNVAEKEKPTQAQQKAYAQNIKKAQAARHAKIMKE